ncbi:MAG: hypothetical protein AAGC49_02405 [Brevundimonas sp.]
MNRAEVRPAVVAFVVGAGAAAVPLRIGSALLVGLAIAALVTLVRRLDAEQDPELPGTVRRARDGQRGEVQDLAWSLAGPDGRTGERASRRVRAVGAARLARHGIDLTDPRDTHRAVALVGNRAYAALTSPYSSTLTSSDARHVIDVLERLGSNPKHPTETP